MKPSYLTKLTPNELKDKTEELYQIQDQCRLCPNHCEVERKKGSLGKCNASDKVILSGINQHFGEEAPLVGTNGSGTIFFSNCNLSCVYCQNYSISHMAEGMEVNIYELAQLMLLLQNKGCHNINLVTPTHYAPQIMKALLIASEKGLELPIVYNCGGYEEVEVLKIFKDVVDIYMPDVKYFNDENALRYSGVDNYEKVVKDSLKEMFRQVGDLKLSKRGVAQSGLLVRHLVLPNNIAGSEKVIDFISDEISLNTYLNIMDQYHPAFLADKHPELNRGVTDEEYNRIIEYAYEKGLRRGFPKPMSAAL